MTDDLHLWSGLYATDSLEGEELARYERHLATCSDCQAEVAGFHETTDRLAAAAAEPAPPGARDRVLAAVATTRQLPPIVAPPDQSSVESTASVVPLASRRRRPMLWLAVAAAFLLLAGVSSIIISRLDRRAGRAEQIAEIVARTDARTIELRGESGPGAKLVWSPSQSQAVLLADNMPSVDEKKAYELWVIRAGVPQKVAVFRPDGDGSLRQRFPAEMRDGDVLGVTIEPAGGSPQPTTPIVMSSSAV